MEQLKEHNQIQLIRNLDQQLNNFATLDKVVFELIEFGLINASIGTLAESISKGEEVDQCVFCGEFKVIVGTHSECGEIYCSECKEEEEPVSVLAVN